MSPNTLKKPSGDSVLPEGINSRSGFLYNDVKENKPLKLHLSFGGYSDAGLKVTNDDAFTAFLPKEHSIRKFKGAAACIADGVSCSANAQMASQTAVTNFMADYFSTPDFWTVKQSASKVISSINSWLYQQGLRDQTRSDAFVTTFSALIVKSHTAHIMHVGDSRIYLCRDGQIKRITQDHSYQGGGDSYLTRALGIEKNLDLDYRSLKVLKGDRFLLTTDGIHENLTDDRLNHFISHNDTTYDSLEDIARDISSAALEAGSDDNISCLIVDVDSLPVAREKEVHRNLAELKIPPALQVGNKIDQFEIIRILHAGTRSHVYLARDANSDELRVLKMPSLNFEDDEFYLEAFSREQWIGRKLSHEQIMKIYPPTRGSQFLYHICEYIEGKTLRQWMVDNAKPDLDSVRAMLDGMVVPVRALHRDKMVHRDLKPDNFIVNRDGVVKLIDFGTMKVAGIEEMNAKYIADEFPVGDANYIAPEYLVYGSANDASDLFSIATIVYEMIAGQLPFSVIQSTQNLPKSFDKWRYRSLSQLPQPPEGMPEWVNAVLKKSLSPNPLYRYQAMSELVSDLRKPSAEIVKSIVFVPLMERNPLKFWQISSLLLFLIVVFQWVIFTL